MSRNPLALTRMRIRDIPFALQFDGLDDAVQFGSHPAFRLPHGSFAIWAIWIPSATPRVFLAGLQTSLDDRAQMAFYDSVVFVDYLKRAGLRLSEGGFYGPFHDFQWHHYCFGWNDEGMSVFIDGADLTNTEVLGETPTEGDFTMDWPSDPSFNIGDVPGFGVPMKGRAADARIFSERLSPAQVLRLYRRDVNPGSLVARWGFVEGSGTTLSLTEGTGNDGTIINGAEWRTASPMGPRAARGARQPMVGRVHI